MATAIPALDNTYGALYIGVILATALYGVTCVQAWFYLNRYQNDPWYMKLLVGFTWILDTVHQILISHALYIYLVKNFDNPAILGKVVNSLFIEVFFEGFTALFVQTFFVVRIWRLSHGNWFICGVIWALVWAEFVTLMVYTIKALGFSEWTQIKTLKVESELMNIWAFVGDLFIAAAMCYYLWKSRTGFKSSETILNKLMLFAINTGLLTSLDMMVALVMFLVFPNNFIYITFYLQIGRLYLNSLLATLNARMYLREGSNKVHDAAYSLDAVESTRVGAQLSSISNKRPNTKGIEISITREFDQPQFGARSQSRQTDDAVMRMDDKNSYV